MTGMVSTRSVADALAEQLSMPVVDPDPFEIPLSLLQRISEADAELMGILPLHMEDDETVVIAVAAAPEQDLRDTLEAMLKQRVQFIFAAEATLKRARQRAYRRLLTEFPGHTRPARLGALLRSEGLISDYQLHEALEEQSQTGELLGTLLVRKGWMDEAEVSRLLASRLHGGFRTLRADEADPDALRTVGYGLCALYGVVPLRADPGGGPMLLAASAPVNGEVLMLVAAKLGVRVQPLLAPALDVRLALAVASRKAWPMGIAGGLGGMDGAELQAIAADPDWAGDLVDLSGAARDSGQSPINYLLAAGGVSPEMAARLRARALGVALAGPTADASGTRHDWLPPGWALKDDIQLLDVQPGSLVVAAPHPTPSLAREVASLFPDQAIAWRVAPFSNQIGERATEARWQQAPRPQVTAPGGP